MSRQTITYITTRQVGWVELDPVEHKVEWDPSMESKPIVIVIDEPIVVIDEPRVMRRRQ